MARRLTIEWDDHELRVMDADLSGGSLGACRARAFPRSAHEGPRSAADVAAVLRSGLAGDEKLLKEAVLVVSRDAMQVKQLALPAAPDDELPDMVRFQMVRELNAPLEGAALDFAVLPTSRTPDQPLEVFVAAVAPEAMREYQGVAEALGLRCVAMPPRPVAVADLARAVAQSDRRDQKAPATAIGRKPADETVGPRAREALLVIDFTTTAAEMTVLVDDQLVFARSHRWSEPVLEGTVPTAVVARETGRTLTAFRNHLPDCAVKSVVLFGDPDHHGPVAAAISEGVGLNVAIVDPLQALGTPESVKGTPLTAAARARFTALAGAVLAQAKGHRYCLDFLRCKQAPVRRSRRKLYTAAAVSAAVLIVGGSYGLVRAKMARQERLAEALTKHVAQLDQQLQQLGDPIIKSADALRGWHQGEVIWLDELRAFAELFPENTDAYLDQLSLFVETKAGTSQGKISFSAYAKDQNSVTALQNRLRRRREHYRVQPKINQPSSQNAAYERKFGSDVTLVAGAPTPPAPDEPNSTADAEATGADAPDDRDAPASESSEIES